MAIVSGVNIPDNKRVEISLRSIFGIGSTQAVDIVEKAGIEGNPRVRDLTEADLSRIREIVDREKVSNARVAFDASLLRKGMAIAIEPMLNIGDWETAELDDGWTVVTADGSLSAHFEDTVAITKNGAEVLT